MRPHNLNKDELKSIPKLHRTLVVVVVVVMVLALYGFITMRRKYKGTSSMDYWERRSHARGVYPTQVTGHLAHGNSKGEARGRNRHNGNSYV